MNRNQRRFGRVPKKKESEIKLKNLREKNPEIKEVYTSPKIKKESWLEKSMTNRCCVASPNQKNFSQLAKTEVLNDQDQHRLYEPYGIEPIIPTTVAQLKELKKVLCGNVDRVEKCSQYVYPESASPELDYVETSDGSQWQNIENVDDIDQYIMIDKHTQKDSYLPDHTPSTQNIHISDVPRVIIIAKKFSRCKKNDIEVRKLDEKVVCIEYDIYDKSDTKRLVQKMRAFFSIKPVIDQTEGGEGKPAISIPSAIKRNFNIADSDLKSLNEKEVEIIDAKIAENKPYLDDLKKILKRKKMSTLKGKKNTLDLMFLYDMAKRDRSPTRNYSESKMLTKEDLTEVKDLILAKCTSSTYGINRRTIKGEDLGPKSESIGVISKSIVAELLREDAKTNVFDK